MCVCVSVQNTQCLGKYLISTKQDRSLDRATCGCQCAVSYESVCFTCFKGSIIFSTLFRCCREMRRWEDDVPLSHSHEDGDRNRNEELKSSVPPVSPRKNRQKSRLSVGRSVTTASTRQWQFPTLTLVIRRQRRRCRLKRDFFPPLPPVNILQV